MSVNEKGLSLPSWSSHSQDLVLPVPEVWVNFQKELTMEIKQFHTSQISATTSPVVISKIKPISFNLRFLSSQGRVLTQEALDSWARKLHWTWEQGVNQPVLKSLITEPLWREETYPNFCSSGTISKVTDFTAVLHRTTRLLPSSYSHELRNPDGQGSRG